MSGIQRHGCIEERTGVVDLALARVDGLEQLIHLFVAHLLAQIREDCSKLASCLKPDSTFPTVTELSHANVASHVLVKDLEATTILFWFAWVAEAARTVEDFLEGFKVDYTSVISTRSANRNLVCIHSPPTLCSKS